MTRSLLIVAVVVLSTSLHGAAVIPENIVTWEGWFSDEGCAQAAVKSEEVSPNGTACVKKCLDEGKAPVFVNPKSRALYRLKDYADAKSHVGYYLRLTGIVDEKAKTVAVRSVERLGEVLQMCGRTKK